MLAAFYFHTETASHIIIFPVKLLQNLTLNSKGFSELVLDRVCRSLLVICAEQIKHFLNKQVNLKSSNHEIVKYAMLEYYLKFFCLENNQHKEYLLPCLLSLTTKTTRLEEPRGPVFPPSIPWGRSFFNYPIIPFAPR